MLFDVFRPAVAVARRHYPVSEYVTEGLKILVLHGSETGKAQTAAEALGRRLTNIHLFSVEVTPIANYGRPKEKLGAKNGIAPISSIARFDTIVERFNVVVLYISTWIDGAPPPAAADLIEFLNDMTQDSRVGRNYFSPLFGVAVVGFGDRQYTQFCTPAVKLKHDFEFLGAKCLLPLLMVDESIETAETVATWTNNLVEKLLTMVFKSRQDPFSFSPGCGHSQVGSEECCIRLADETKFGSSSSSSSSESDHDELDEATLAKTCDEDVEDVGLVETKPVRHMLTSRQRQQLEHEGYKIVGTHSAVKLCRWTKSQLRGRGGCYKHTFYGIESHLCMEGTPSLACANKCVFCWRHHKNPVGRSWQWQMDSPEEIFQGMKEKHLHMVKELKGVSFKPSLFICSATGVVGVQPERFKESAMAVRHCALSLVGEPIMYPHINDIIRLMHEDHISTFLVTNAQFPDQMRHLRPVTQLYVSVDGASPETLKSIDRPLFPDYWERFTECLTLLKHHASRTVFRLTLVKKYNMEEAAQFGRLIADHLPDFIEIKAVTYCGTSGKTNTITMKDIPWHDEVVAYARAILASNPVLQGHNKFNRDGQWHTWIDYEKFFVLDASGEKFTSLDYCAPTPDWAVFGAKEQGFDPQEQRIHAKGKYKRRQRLAESSTMAFKQTQPLSTAPVT